MNASAITGTSYGFSKNTSGTRLSSILTQQAVNRVWLRTQLHTTCFSFGNSEIKPLVILNNSRNHNTRKKSRLRRIWNARFYLWRKRIAVAFSFANIYSYLRRKWKNLLLGACLACILAMGSYLLQLTATYAPKSVPYSSLIQSLESQKVKSVVFEEGSSQIFFNVVEEDDKTLPAVEFCTRKIRHDEGYLLGLLRTGNVEYSSAPRNLGSIFASVAGTIITLWIPLSPLLWLMHRQLSGRADMSKNRKRKSIQSVKFEDVAGVDTAKAELWEIVSCLRGQTKFRKLGAKFPKGVLLIGPPGTGKTLLARALAGEAGVPFFAASASEFVEMFVGRGAARIRELFAMARKYAPSVIFIDELDAVGGQRGRGFNDERDQTLNQLLTEMDGFETERGVLVLAATNRAEALDPALCRAGRFSRKVYVREPDLEGRKQVLAVHMRDVPVEGDAESVRSFVAAITPGFVGADLANVVNEAALLAARKGQEAVALDDFKEAVYRSKYGVGGESGVLSSLERKICGLLQSVKPRGQDNGNVYPVASS